MIAIVLCPLEPDYILKEPIGLLKTYNNNKLKKEEAQKLLKRYRLGQCTKRESEIINQWYQSFDDVEIDLKDSDRLNKVKSEMLKNIATDISKIEKNRGSGKSFDKPARRFEFLHFNNLKRIAAVFLIFGMGLAFFFYNQQEEVIVENNEVIRVIPSTKVLPSIIYLSDGSKVKLKEGSRLEYPINFTGETREVTLIGEAFFEVAKNKEKPFIIHSANLTTKVLGTSFNIKAYENDESTEIAVVTGKVSVSINNIGPKDGNKREELVLIPNQKAVYSRKEDSLVQTELNEEIKTDSDEKVRLVFNETSLEEIISVLNDYYEVNIKLGNKNMKSCLITAELTDEPIEVSLKIITKAIGADFEMKEEEIILKGNGCSFN